MSVIAGIRSEKSSLMQNSKDVMACQLGPAEVAGDAPRKALPMLGIATRGINSVVMTAQLRHQAQTSRMVNSSKQVR
jgi:hypothetical protein